jgi:aryl-alcohol dehydrogenase-like predicted oxidoreductase
MDKSNLGNSQLTISRIGLGTWAIAGQNYLFNIGNQDDSESIRLIHYAIDQGVNWIDTAPVYGLGHAEDIVCKALRQKPHAMHIFTKCGIIWDTNGENIRGCLKADSMRIQVEESLRRLQVETIDLLQVHWPNPDADLEEGWQAIAELIRSGKVRYAGASNFSADQIRRVQQYHPCVSYQPPYNLFQREIESQEMPYCRDQNIGIIAYSPLRVGLLSGSFSLERWQALPRDDWRLQYDDYRDGRFQINLIFIEKLRQIAVRKQCSVAQLSASWVLNQPGINGIILGARRVGQFEESLAAAKIELSSDDFVEIEQALAERLGHLEKAGVLAKVFVEPHETEGKNQ